MTTLREDWNAELLRWEESMFSHHDLMQRRQAMCPVPVSGKRCKGEGNTGCLCAQLRSVDLVDHSCMWKRYGGPVKVWTSEPYVQTADVRREITRLGPAFAVFGLRAEVFDWSPYGGDNVPTLIKVSPVSS